jgi:hypothetical protein
MDIVIDWLWRISPLVLIIGGLAYLCKPEESVRFMDGIAERYPWLTVWFIELPGDDEPVNVLTVRLTAIAGVIMGSILTWFNLSAS